MSTTSARPALSAVAVVAWLSFLLPGAINMQANSHQHCMRQQVPLELMMLSVANICCNSSIQQLYRHASPPLPAPALLPSRTATAAAAAAAMDAAPSGKRMRVIPMHPPPPPAPLAPLLLHGLRIVLLHVLQGSNWLFLGCSLTYDTVVSLYRGCYPTRGFFCC